VPAITLLLALFVSPWFLLLILSWPLQMLRMIRRGEVPLRAAFLVLGKLPEALGILEFWFKHLTSAKRSRIDYK